MTLYICSPVCVQHNIRKWKNNEKAVLWLLWGGPGNKASDHLYVDLLCNQLLA